MRTTRRGGKEQLVRLSGPTELHLFTGNCLIPSVCQICSGNLSQSEALGKAPYTLNDNAGDVWQRNRERLLEIWRDPEGRGRQPGGSGFNASAYHGAGRLGLPCWAEMRLDGVKLPKYKQQWPKDVKKAWDALRP